MIKPKLDKSKLATSGYMLLFIAGLVSITFGVQGIYKPLGPIVGGLFAIWLAFLFAGSK